MTSVEDGADDAAQSEVGEGFPPPERKVITQSYDLSVQTLLEQWDSGQLILPEIQREYVWDNPRASRLVESLLLNIPIPVLYLAETNDARWEIIDGHQRVRSTVRFIKNEFALSGLQVLSELNRKRFFRLPEREQRFLTTRTMRAVVISDDSHPNMKFEIFERLNRGSLILNEQELRNSLYRGPFNRMLRELVKQAAFRSLIGTKSPRKRMVDEEFCLRFFALHDDIVGYRPPLKKFLNDYMRSVQNADPETLDELREDFNSAVARVNACLHDRAFRMTDARGAVVERAPNRALFDAQMLAFSWARDDDLAQHRSAIIREFGRLYSDNDFVDSISLATGDRVRTRLRVRRALEALVEAGVEVEAPNIPA